MFVTTNCWVACALLLRMFSINWLHNCVEGGKRKLRLILVIPTIYSGQISIEAMSYIKLQNKTKSRNIKILKWRLVNIGCKYFSFIFVDWNGLSARSELPLWEPLQIEGREGGGNKEGKDTSMWEKGISEGERRWCVSTFTWQTRWGTPPSDRTDPWPQTEQSPGWHRRRAAVLVRGSCERQEYGISS